MIYALLAYVAAMTLANLSIAAFGPWVSPINSFIFIGFDLVLRDWLHVRLRVWQMGLLIAVTGVLTYLLNPAAAHIALASAVSFTAASCADWFAFSKIKGTWLKRSVWSNTAGAAVDSVIFPTLAFGTLMPVIVLLQFIAKVGGGAVWALAMNRLIIARRPIA